MLSINPKTVNEIEPNIYFHEDREIQEWIEKITQGSQLI